MISIIVPTASQGGKYLKDLLPVICNEPNTQVIIVDNASTDNTHDICKRYNLHYIKNATNLGFAKACNLGASRAQGEYLIFLNNDTYPAPHFTNLMLQAYTTSVYSRGAEMGALGVKIVFMKNGQLQHAGIHFNPQGFAYEVRDQEYANKERELHAVTAACMMIRKSVFDRVGGFDEVYINGWEDVDLCMKIRELGYRIIYTPKVTIKHVHMGTDGRLKCEDRNRNYFKSKWIDTGKLFKITGAK